MVSAALERLWTDRCDVYVREGAVDPDTGRTMFLERQIYEELPCRVSFRVSFETVSAVRDVAGIASMAGQTVKLFLDPNVRVPAGSKIVVRRFGQETAYVRSGMPAIYEGHQEIRVELFRNWT
ncbi:MAG: hypothetical protein FWD99_06405 [Oscillospiraceae bacterium]|nr:hypothetical protein [Oscillospiraceae bacterium]